MVPTSNLAPEGHSFNAVPFITPVRNTLLDRLDLDPTLLEPVAKTLRAPFEFAACLNQLGTYTTEHFVLRLSPKVYELVDAVPSGVYAAGELDGATLQAFSTYIHETVHNAERRIMPRGGANALRTLVPAARRVGIVFLIGGVTAWKWNDRLS
jgi:hypothetical protein